MHATKVPGWSQTRCVLVKLGHIQGLLNNVFPHHRSIVHLRWQVKIKATTKADVGMKKICTQNNIFNHKYKVRWSSQLTEKRTCTIRLSKGK